MEGKSPKKPKESFDSLVKLVQADFYRADLPAFQAGDTVSVHVRIPEGDKFRIQQYQGVVIQRRGIGGSETVTVRKISGGIGVERIFPVHSPMVEKFDIVKRGRVRRAKLFYLRKKSGKAARIRERIS